MRANAWERIGKELKIKSEFYVSSRDVRRVCPHLRFQNKVLASHNVSMSSFYRTKASCIITNTTNSLCVRTKCNLFQ